MGILNYSSYVHKMEVGLRRNGMHPMAVLLLTSITKYPSVKNRWGNPYTISRTEARDWYHGAQSIPQGIKDGADNSAVVRGIEQYFEDNVVPEIYSDKEQDVLDGILELVHDDKRIQKTTRKKLEKLYADGEIAAFLSTTFLLAIKNENGLFQRPVRKKKSKPLAETDDIEEFENLMKQRYKKPDSMTPPKELAEHELTYATELLAAYADAAKVPEMVREDLQAPGNARFSRDFDRQRRFYYMAETILEASKDMLKLKESESLSANVRLGIQFRNQQGKVRVNHNWFLGYTKDEEGKLVIDPEQAKIVQRIYAEYLDGKSLLQIKRSLEADGISNGAGHKKWHESNIKQILTNEKYIGDAFLEKTYTVSVLDKKRAVNDGILPKYYVEGSHEAIISRDIFLQVQSELRRRSNLNAAGKKRVYSGKYALSSIVYCAHCGDIYRRIA